MNEVCSECGQRLPKEGIPVSKIEEALGAHQIPKVEFVPDHEREQLETYLSMMAHAFARALHGFSTYPEEFGRPPIGIPCMSGCKAVLHGRQVVITINCEESSDG